MKPYYQDNSRTVYCKSCHDMSELSDNSVHMAVFSPPYWGLRKYADVPDLTWDDKEGCEHEWVDSSVLNHNQALNNARAGYLPESKEPSGKRIMPSSVCQKCGAWRGQLGLEPTPELYLSHLVQILREVRRVLRSDGTCWLNIGDSHAGSGKGLNGDGLDGGSGQKQSTNLGSINTVKQDSGLKPGDLCLIPQRLAILLQQDGWWVHSIVVWAKPNPMPESVSGWSWQKHRVKIRNLRTKTTPYALLSGNTSGDAGPGLSYNPWAEYQDCPGCPKCLPNDGLVLRRGNWRPTRAHEYIIMLAKSEHHYGDGEAVREPHSRDWSNETPSGYLKPGNTVAIEAGIPTGHIRSSIPPQMNPDGRNLRNVWTFATQPHSEAHFATFPDKLPEICIKAGTSEKGVCPKCAAPWARIIQSQQPPDELYTKTNRPDDGFVNAWNRRDGVCRGSGQAVQNWREDNPSKTLGWRPTCLCNAGEPIPATVLDPFCGSGTTLAVATKLGRKSIGYDISTKYMELIIDRNRQQGLAVMPLSIPEPVPASKTMGMFETDG